MDQRRQWIATVLLEALRLNVLKANDLIRHLPPDVLATDLPPALVAQVLKAGLESGAFDAQLLVETLGVNNLAEHGPLPLLWGCIDEAAGTIAREHSGASSESGDSPQEPVIDPNNVSSEDIAFIEVLDE